MNEQDNDLISRDAAFYFAQTRLFGRPPDVPRMVCTTLGSIWKVNLSAGIGVDVDVGVHVGCEYPRMAGSEDPSLTWILFIPKMDLVPSQDEVNRLIARAQSRSRRLHVRFDPEQVWDPNPALHECLGYMGAMCQRTLMCLSSQVWFEETE